MKTKSVLSVAVTLLAVITLSSFMQGSPADFREVFRKNPETRAHVVTMIMKNKLALDDSQAEKAWQVNLKYAKMNQPYLKEEGAVLENMDKLIQLNKTRGDELKAILTAEQIDMTKEMRRQWISRLEKILTLLKENESSNH